MTVKLLTEHQLGFLSFKGDCTGLSESTLVKMPHCWKSHVVAHILVTIVEGLSKPRLLPNFSFFCYCIHKCVIRGGIFYNDNY